MKRRWVTLVGALALLLLLGSVALSVYSHSLPPAERPYVVVGALFCLGALAAAFWLLSRAVLYLLRRASITRLGDAGAGLQPAPAVPGGPAMETRWCLECGNPFRWRADHPRNQLCPPCRLADRLEGVATVMEDKR